MRENGPVSGTQRKAVAIAVRVELARAGVSGNEMARRLGMPSSTFGRRMTADLPFTADHLVNIAHELGIPVATLFPDEVAA